VFFRAEEPGLPPYAEQLAAFKAEKGVGLRALRAREGVARILKGRRAA